MNRIYYLDFLRCIACFAVVAIHSTADYVFNRGLGNKVLWAFSLSLNALSHWAVPVFIMVSGGLLLKRYGSLKTQNVRAFYKKRFGRMSILIVVWSTIYLAWVALYRHNEVNFHTVVHDLLLGNTFMHLYFLFLILGLYFITPFLANLCQQLTRKQLYYFSIGLILAAGVWHGIYFFANHMQPPSLNIFGQWIPYIGYYVAGYAGIIILERTKVISKKLIVLAIIPSVLMVIAIYLAVKLWGGTLYFHEYIMPLGALQALGIFVLGKAAYDWLHKVGGERVNGMIRFFAPLTLGIYLIHIIFLDLFKKIIVPEGEAHSTIQVVILLLATFVVSACSVYVIRQSVFARKYILPE